MMTVESGRGDYPTPGLLPEGLDLGHLTDAERDVIFAVIRRDEILRQKELEAVEVIKQDIDRLVEFEKQTEVVEEDARFDASSAENKKFCARCGSEFGWIINRGDICSKCHLRVCEKCKHLVTTKERWLCTLCFKRLELHIWTGAWLRSSMNRAKRNHIDIEQQRKLDTNLNNSSNRLIIPSSTDDEEGLSALGTVTNNNNKNENEEHSADEGHSSAENATDNKLQYNNTTDDEKTSDDVAYVRTEETGVASPRDQDSPSPGEVFTDNEPSVENIVRSTSSTKSHGSTASGTKRARSQISIGSTESLSSAYSNMGRVSYGKFAAAGDILLSYQYNTAKNVFEVTIRQCKDIAAVDTVRNASNPYVKIYLLPDKSRAGKRKTRIKKKTLSPVYNEQFTYRISREELKSRTLWVAVWHHEPFTTNEYLSDVAIPLRDQPCTDNTPNWYKLQQDGGGKWKSVLSLVSNGEISVIIRWTKIGKGKKEVSKSSGELQVTIKSAKNLACLKTGDESNVFCKCRLLPQATTYKTSVVKNSMSPTFNHTVTFSGLSGETLEHLGIEITVWEYSRFKSNDFLGGIRLNNGSGLLGGRNCHWKEASDVEVGVWQRISENPGDLIEETIPLRLDMETTVTK